MRKKVVLESSVFFWDNSQHGLLYDWISSATLSFSEQDPAIRSLCEQWKDLDNLYAAYFDALEEETQVYAFVKAIVDKGLGAIYDADAPVVSFPPVLKVNHSVERKDYFGGLESQALLPYLVHLRVYIGGLSDGGVWWKQVAYPKDSAEHLDAKRLFRFLQCCDLHSLTQIDLVISDWDEKVISEFFFGFAILNLINKVRFIFAHPDPGFNNDILGKLAEEGFSITQVCLPNVGLKKGNWIEGRNYQFLVRSEEDAEQWEELVGENPSVRYDYKPIADDNLDFFRKNVFLSEAEILGQKLSKKEIFRHQALNVNQFGTLHIFPDGTIHPAADAPTIGTLEDSVHQTIIRELEENYAWRQTRDQMTPCKDCLYRYLCPSPSVYEKFFGVPGCTYWKE